MIMIPHTTWDEYEIMIKCYTFENIAWSWWIEKVTKLFLLGRENIAKLTKGNRGFTIITLRKSEALIPL